MQPFLHWCLIPGRQMLLQGTLDYVGVHSTIASMAMLLPLQNNVAADTLLYFCKRLWGLPYLAPTFALLLHR